MERKRRREKRSEVALGKSQGVYKKERFFRGGVGGPPTPPGYKKWYISKTFGGSGPSCVEKTICFASWRGKGLRGGVWSRKVAKGVEVGTARMCRKIQGLRLIILRIFLKGLKKFFL